MLSTDTRERTLQLVKAIAGSSGLTIPNCDYDADVETETLQRVEQLARAMSLLPPLPSDMATVTSSIGTSSRDYSTITSWEADLDNGAIYSSSDDAVGECYNDSVFDEAITINGGGTVGLSSVLLSVASGERHDGTAGTGARIVRTGADGITVSGAIRGVEWLEIEGRGSGSGTDRLFQTTGANSASGPFGRNLLIHGNATSDNHLSAVRAVESSMVLLNTIIYDVENTHSGSGYSYGLELAPANYNYRIQNVTILGVTNNNGSGDCHGVFSGDKSLRHLQNIISMDCGGTTSGTVQDFSTASFSSATADHNLASDTSASGTGSIDSASSSDQFVSTTAGSEDLHLKSGADAIDAGTDLGTTPSGIEVDINGRDRDAEGDTWDIGAHEFVAAAGVATPKGVFGQLVFAGPLGGPI